MNGTNFDEEYESLSVEELAQIIQEEAVFEIVLDRHVFEDIEDICRSHDRSAMAALKYYVMRGGMIGKEPRESWWQDGKPTA